MLPVTARRAFFRSLKHNFLDICTALLYSTINVEVKIMYFRFGTLLKLTRDVLEEQQSVFSRRIKIPATTVTAYMAGTRFPRNDLPSVFYAVSEFFRDTFAEFGWDHVDVEGILMKSMNLERAFRNLLEFDPLSFQKATANLLVAMGGSGRPDPWNCLEIVFHQDNGRPRDEIAAYLVELGCTGGFLEHSGGGYAKPMRLMDPGYLAYDKFSQADPMPFIASPPLCIDALMALPDEINVTIDQNYSSIVELTVGGESIKMPGEKLTSLKW